MQNSKPVERPFLFLEKAAIDQVLLQSWNAILTLETTSAKSIKGMNVYQEQEISLRKRLVFTQIQNITVYENIATNFADAL